MIDPRLLADDRLRLIASLRLAVADMDHAQAAFGRLVFSTETDANFRAAIAAGGVVSYSRP